MSSFISRLIHGRALSSDDLIRPFSQRIKQALLEENLHTAVAFLTKAIEIAPERLDLVLMRAQVLQYGLSNLSSALKDYRHVLSELEVNPDRDLENKCRTGMRDMMAD